MVDKSASQALWRGNQELDFKGMEVRDVVV